MQPGPRVGTLAYMEFPQIGGLAAGKTRRRYGLLAAEDHDLIVRLRKESALPVAVIAALLCTTETAVARVCRDRSVIPNYPNPPHRRKARRMTERPLSE